MTYWITDAVSSGQIDNLYTAKILRNGCFDASTSLEGSHAGSFTVQNMSGALMMVAGTAFAVCAALMVDFIKTRVIQVR
jgi:hypothetical protein